MQPTVAQKAYDFMVREMRRSGFEWFTVSTVHHEIKGSEGAVAKALQFLADRTNRVEIKVGVGGVRMFRPLMRSDMKPFSRWPQESPNSPLWWKHMPAA